MNTILAVLSKNVKRVFKVFSQQLLRNHKNLAKRTGRYRKITFRHVLCVFKSVDRVLENDLGGKRVDDRLALFSSRVRFVEEA